MARPYKELGECMDQKGGGFRKKPMSRAEALEMKKMETLWPLAAAAAPNCLIWQN